MKVGKYTTITNLWLTGRIQCNTETGEVTVFKQDKTTPMKWNNASGYDKLGVNGWNIARHEVVAVIGGIKCVDKHEKLYINHKDGRKSNCKLSNLEAVNNSENNSHAWKLGLKKPTQSKLVLHDVLHIHLVRRATSWTVGEIADFFMISPTHVSSILTGHRWGNVSLEDYFPRVKVGWYMITVGTTYADVIKLMKSNEDYIEEILDHITFLPKKEGQEVPVPWGTVKW